jgi:hypothetical protein
MELDGLYAQFANVKTQEDLLDFVNRFGLLYEVVTVDIADALKNAELFRLWLSYDAEAIARWAGPNGKEFGRVAVFIVRDQVTGEPRFQYRPPSLLSALWLQLMGALMRQRPFRECLHCGAWFEVGPGTGRRIDAKFCQDDHRILFNRRKTAAGYESTKA